jgi:hypothetical protein
MSQSTLKVPSARRARRPRRATVWGLLADATHGGVTVELDEGLNGHGWCLRLATSGVSIPLDVDGTATLSAAVRLLRSPHRTPHEVVNVGTWEKHPANLVRDDEFDDRAYLIVGRPRSVPIRLTFVGSSYDGLLAALAEVAQQVTDPAD